VSRFVFVADPDVLEYVLKTKFENFEKGPVFHRLFEVFLGNGIFNADGQIWKLQRQTASHLFAVKELKIYAETFAENTKKVIELLKEKLSTDDKKQVVDIQDVFQRFTLDSITKIAFGVEVNSLRTENSFAKAFDQCNESIAFRNINPIATVRSCQYI
jgi:cytochrome P450